MITFVNIIMWSLIIWSSPQPIPVRHEVCPGATHFYNWRTLHNPPHWAKHMVKVCRIGDHDFYQPKSTSKGVR